MSGRTSSAHPRLYEVHAQHFLARLAPSIGLRPTLTDVPQEVWEGLRGRGFDLVWLMGVWRRSAGARERALSEPALRSAYDRVLPGWTSDDVAGSPYAVGGHALDPSLGRPEDLRRLRDRLHRAGLGLVVDFVPNHLALDHPWVAAHPERFVRADVPALRDHPERFFTHDGVHHFAHGRDPYFPPWTDTVQVDFFEPELRRALADELLAIAEVADGVRCDMAMLGLGRIFAEVWRGLARAQPPVEPWTELIEAVRRRHPGFLFLAEAYWGTEPELFELGFDYAYDKDLYDRLRHGSAAGVVQHVRAQASPERRVRFVENHDEPRAVEAFGRDRSLAAAAAAATLPGMWLVHDGQLEGRRLHVPIQLARAPEERADADVAAAYERILHASGEAGFRRGSFQLLDSDDADLLAWGWRDGDRLALAVIAFADRRIDGRIALGGLGADLRELASTGLGAGSGAELRGDGDLQVALEPWAFRFFHSPARVTRR